MVGAISSSIPHSLAIGQAVGSPPGGLQQCAWLPWWRQRRHPGCTHLQAVPHRRCFNHRVALLQGPIPFITLSTTHVYRCKRRCLEVATMLVTGLLQLDPCRQTRKSLHPSISTATQLDSEFINLPSWLSAHSPKTLATHCDPHVHVAVSHCSLHNQGQYDSQKGLSSLIALRPVPLALTCDSATIERDSCQARHSLPLTAFSHKGPRRAFCFVWPSM